MLLRRSRLDLGLRSFPPRVTMEEWLHKRYHLSPLDSEVPMSGHSNLRVLLDQLLLAATLRRILSSSSSSLSLWALLRLVLSFEMIRCDPDIFSLYSFPPHHFDKLSNLDENIKIPMFRRFFGRTNLDSLLYLHYLLP